MQKIKIVFIHWALYMGGTQKQFVEMAPRLNRDRFEVHVLTFREGGKIQAILEASGIPVTDLNFPKLRGKYHPGSYVKFYQLMWQMIRFLRQEQPHIVQSFLPWANICGTIAAKTARVPVIITGRRANIRERYMDFRRFPDQWLQDLCNVWTTVVLANSYNVKQECLQREKYLAEKKIQVIYNGVDAARYAITSEKAATKKALGIPDDSMIVGIIASLHPRKGHRDFLKAASIVLRRHPGTVFLIVGQDVGIRQELEDLAGQFHIDDGVRFTGERDDIPEILGLLDVQVSASYVEGLSNALLEGMAAGKPIVATDVAGNSELVIHEQTGLLVPPGDPESLAGGLIGLLEDKVLRERYGNAARRRVETLFRMEHMIHQTETLYESLVKKGA